MKIDRQKYKFYELSIGLCAIMHDDLLYNRSVREKYGFPDGMAAAGILFMFEVNPDNNKVSVLMQADCINFYTDLDGYVKSKVNLNSVLGNPTTVAEEEIISDLSKEKYFRVIWQYPDVDESLLDALFSYLRITEGALMNRLTEYAFNHFAFGEKFRLNIRKQLVKANAKPRTFSFGHGTKEPFGCNTIYFETEEAAKRAKAILDQYAYHTDISKSTGKKYQYKLHFKIDEETLMVMCFEPQYESFRIFKQTV